MKAVSEPLHRQVKFPHVATTQENIAMVNRRSHNRIQLAVSVRAQQVGAPRDRTNLLGD